MKPRIVATAFALAVLPFAMGSAFAQQAQPPAQPQAQPQTQHKEISPPETAYQAGSSPLAGVIVGSNRAAADDPALIGADPYDKGWLIELQAADWAAAVRELVSGDPIVPAFDAAMALDNFAGVDS